MTLAGSPTTSKDTEGTTMTTTPTPQWKLICRVDDIPVLVSRRVALP